MATGFCGCDGGVLSPPAEPVIGVTGVTGCEITFSTLPKYEMAAE